MLSAAHVLAMDAKNLFDVVDSIRQRYHHLFPPPAAKRIPKAIWNWLRMWASSWETCSHRLTKYPCFFQHRPWS